MSMVHTRTVRVHRPLENDDALAMDLVSTFTLPGHSKPHATFFAS